MSWLYDYRIFSYVVAMGCEVAVFVQCTETLKLADHVAGGSFTYARLGVSAAALTILPLVYILFCECINRPAPIRMELASLPACAVLWLAVGALSVTSKRHNFGDGPCDSPSHTLSDICSYADPIMTFSFVPAGVMMLYELVLLLVAGCSARKGKPVWVHAVRGPELKEAML